jgi:hypothetical protein
MFNYLRLIFCSSWEYRVKDVWTHRYRPKADLAVVKLPEIKTIIWVEVQDTKLSEKSWAEKIQWSVKMCEELFVVITSNLIKDLNLIKKLLSHHSRPHKIFVFEPRSQKLFRITSDGKWKIIEINSKITEKEVQHKLNKYIFREIS